MPFTASSYRQRQVLQTTLPRVHTLLQLTVETMCSELYTILAHVGPPILDTEQFIQSAAPNMTILNMYFLKNKYLSPYNRHLLELSMDNPSHSARLETITTSHQLYKVPLTSQHTCLSATQRILHELYVVKYIVVRLLFIFGTTGKTVPISRGHFGHLDAFQMEYPIAFITNHLRGLPFRIYTTYGTRRSF